jgi:class 3 adenylate cyclase/tetratricopeptide (TPR) repeat protein
VQICPNCGEENPPRFRLCGFCGTQLAPDLPPQEVRKVVSVVFCDLKGSTSLGETLDSESLREVMNDYFDEMRGALEQHGGTVEKFIGDAVMAVFGLPRLHEDDALRAVRAATAMQRGLTSLNESLQIRFGVRLANRIGVNTGEVVAGDPAAGQRLVTGDAVNVAARLEQAAGTNQVLIGELTYRLVRESVDVETVEPLTLKGKAEPVAAYRLVAVAEGDGRPRSRGAAMVGREDELASLLGALQEAVLERACRAATIVGHAGVGKSRLLEALTKAVGADAVVLAGRCLPYGDGITFWPLREIVRKAAGIVDQDSTEGARAKLAEVIGDDSEVTERIASAVGLSPRQFPVQELFWAARKLFELLARRQPLVVVLEDIHWAEPTFLELIEHLAQAIDDAPVLVLSAARPELLEQHPDWGAGPEELRLLLEPLTRAESERVIDNLLGQAELADDIRERIVAGAQGNPLFVEQLLSMMIDDGLLELAEGRWQPTAELAGTVVPPTIYALLAARLDRLAREERSVVEPASVIGYVFAQDAVGELAPPPLQAQVEEYLAVLTAKQFIQPDASGAAEADFRFQHILIRDTAYDGLLKRSRATLHEKFVRWADRVNGDRALEFEEILGYHLEQAYRYLAELGPLDANGREIGADGADRLGSAGRRAFTRGDVAAAVNLLRRAASLLPEDNPRRIDLQIQLGTALVKFGELEEADTVLSEAMDRASKMNDALRHALALVERHFVKLKTDPEGTTKLLSPVAEEAIAVFQEHGDELGLARAWRLRSEADRIVCRFGKQGESLERALLHARRAGDAREEAEILVWLQTSLCFGPTPVGEAIRRCEEILVHGRDFRWVESATLGMLSYLHAMQGRFSEARDLYARSRAILEELGMRFALAGRTIVPAAAETLAGDHGAAESVLRWGYEVLEEMGETELRSTVAAYLAETLYEQGRYDDAEAFSRISEQLASEDDLLSGVTWRGARAKVLARRGLGEEAEQLAREGVTLAGSTDCLGLHGGALLDLAEVLSVLGREEEAALLSDDAFWLFERKGDTISAGRALALKEAGPASADKPASARTGPA